LSPDKISKKGKKERSLLKLSLRKLKKAPKIVMKIMMMMMCYVEFAAKKRKRKNFGYHVIPVYCGITEIVSDWIMKKNGTTFWGKIPFIFALCVSDKTSLKKMGQRKNRPGCICIPNIMML
jgi:hypothetical protein